jgi:hypothetical protein
MCQTISWRLKSIIGIDVNYRRQQSQDKARRRDLACQKEFGDWGCDNDDVRSNQPRGSKFLIKIVPGLNPLFCGVKLNCKLFLAD